MCLPFLNIPSKYSKYENNKNENTVLWPTQIMGNEYFQVVVVLLMYNDDCMNLPKLYIRSQEFTCKGCKCNYYIINLHKLVHLYVSFHN